MRITITIKTAVIFLGLYLIDKTEDTAFYKINYSHALLDQKLGRVYSQKPYKAIFRPAPVSETRPFDYHQRELPQHKILRVCRAKTFVATSILLSRQKTVLSPQTRVFLDKSKLVATNVILSRQAYLFAKLLSRQKLYLLQIPPMIFDSLLVQKLDTVYSQKPYKAIFRPAPASESRPFDSSRLDS